MTIKTMFGAAAVLAQLALMAQSAHAADVTIRVEGLERAEGRLMVAVFDKAEEFPRGTRRFGEMAEQHQRPVAGFVLGQVGVCGLAPASVCVLAREDSFDKW